MKPLPHAALAAAFVLLGPPAASGRSPSGLLGQFGSAWNTALGALRELWSSVAAVDPNATFFLVALGLLAAFSAGVLLLLWTLVWISRRKLRAPIAAAALVIYGDLVSQIENAFISFFQGIWNGIQSFFGTIFQSLANAIASIFSAPITAINASWTSFQNWVNGTGPLAPILTMLTVVGVFLLAAWLIWIVIKLSVSQSEQIGEEVEEGA